MKNSLTSLARRIWPDYDSLPIADRSNILMNLSGMLFSLPWLALGVVWFVYVVDPNVLLENWAMMLFILVASVILERVPFFSFINLGGEKYGSNSSDLSTIVIISAYFIYGPTAVTIMLVKTLITYGLNWSPKYSMIHQMVWLRNLLFNTASPLLGILAGLWVYGAAGGRYPFSGESLVEWLAALLALLVYWGIIASLFLLWTLLLFRSGVMLLGEGGTRTREDHWKLYLGSFSFLILADTPGVFGLLAAVLFVQIGFWMYAIFLLTVLLVSILARRMSLAVMVSRQKSGELDQLEQLGRAIIASSSDVARLPELLEQYLPGMLSYRQIEIRLDDGRHLANLPADRPLLDDSIWEYLRKRPEPLDVPYGDTPPWSGSPTPERWVLTPILSTETQAPIGGICLVQDRYLFTGFTLDNMPVLQVLAAQIATALHAAQVYADTLEHQKVSQELAFAGEIQASFLPESLPQIEGWEIAAALEPARETSGDFYDLIALPSDRLSIIVADVTDKGVGAALFMALSRTLIRTYALEYPAEPARVMASTNQRLLMDATAGLFVTVFYGVLDTRNGELVYANAGHNPPLWLRSDQNGDALVRTGMALGVMEGESWGQERRQIETGDRLVLFTDGVSEAQNSAGDFYGDERLQDLVTSHSGGSADETQAAILADIQKFAGDAPQADDLTLLVVKRDHE